MHWWHIIGCRSLWNWEDLSKNGVHISQMVIARNIVCGTSHIVNLLSDSWIPPSVRCQWRGYDIWPACRMPKLWETYDIIKLWVVFGMGKFTNTSHLCLYTTVCFLDICSNIIQSRLNMTGALSQGHFLSLPRGLSTNTYFFVYIVWRKHILFEVSSVALWCPLWVTWANMLVATQWPLKRAPHLLVATQWPLKRVPHLSVSVWYGCLELIGAICAMIPKYSLEWTSFAFGFPITLCESNLLHSTPPRFKQVRIVRLWLL